MRDYIRENGESYENIIKSLFIAVGTSKKAKGTNFILQRSDFVIYLYR